MRRRFVYDKELDCVVEIGNGSNTPAPEQRLPPSGVMRDIQDYKTVAIDVATGKRAVITSRSRHREFLKRNGYIEIGNSFVPNQHEKMPSIGESIKRALQEKGYD